MSIGPTNLGGISGVPLAQAQGPELDRARMAASARERQALGETQADSAAGIGATDGENTDTHDRDADGRQPWQRPQHPPRDPDDPRGQQLDVSG